MANEKEIDHRAVEQDYNGGMKYKDLAEKYGVSINTVKSWKTRYRWQRKGEKKCAHKDEESVHTKKRVQKEEIPRKKPKSPKQVEALGMTNQQRLFADEYLIDLNATQAAIRAGYSPRTAQQQSSDLLSKPLIRDYIDQILAEQSRRTGITIERILREYARIALLNPSKVIDTATAAIRNDATEDDLAAIQSIKVKATQSDKGDSIEREVKFASKQAALERLEKYFGRTLQEAQDNSLDTEHLRIERERLDLEKQKAKSGMDETDAQKINEQIESLADLINNPVPNRKIEED